MNTNLIAKLKIPNFEDRSLMTSILVAAGYVVRIIKDNPTYSVTPTYYIEIHEEVNHDRP